MKKQEVVVVLGAGRSGTSLTMSLAASLGVSMSPDLVGPGENNKKGAFEDVNILRISRSILRHFHRDGAALSFLPLPDGWLDDPFVQQARASLLQIVAAETEGSRFWGFKEPVTAKLLPLWHSIFAELGIKPVYLLSLRHPEGVNASFQKAYGVPPQVSTLVWMSRYIDAVQSTGGDFEVFDYDEWFNAPLPALSRLAGCIGVDFDADSFKVEEVIDPSIRTTEPLENAGIASEAIALYRVLMAYKAGEAGLDEVRAAAAAAQACIDGFSALCYSVDTLGAKLDAAGERLEEAKGEAARFKADASAELAQRNACERQRQHLESRLERQQNQLETEQSRTADLELRLSDPISHMLARREVPRVEGRVIVGVASFPAREAVFAETIASIYAQVDHIYVYLNGYTDVPQFLRRRKITVFLSRDYMDLSANGKVFSLGEVDDCYFFTIDDDILYPGDYVQKMLACMQRYDNKVAVCVHGSVFPEKPEWYYERTALYPFQGELETDKFVTLVGSGTFAFHTSVLKARFEDFLPNVMVDLRFSILAREQGVPLVSLARPKKWLKALVQGEGLYQDFLFRRTIHTEKVVEHAPWGFDIYADMVRKSLPEQLLQLPAEDLQAGQFDVEFIEAVRGGTLPPDWSDTELYRLKLEEREFVQKPMAMYRSVQRQLEQSRKRLDVEQAQKKDMRRQRNELQKQKDQLNAQLVESKGKLEKIRRSRGFRAARLVAAAIRQPVWNMLLLPARLLKLAIKG